MTAPLDDDKPRRVCRTPEECFQAGYADGVARSERMPAQLVDRMVALLGPHLLPKAGEHEAA